MKKGKVEIVRFIRKTAGGNHAWYEARVTDDKGTAIVSIRKPVIPTSTSPDSAS
jgi:hypothetical protein